MFTCANEDKSLLFINNNVSVRPFRTQGDVSLHSELLQILGYDDKGNMIYKFIETTEILEVG